MTNEKDRRDLLAAEYVLGTLQGAARLQFENLMRQDSDLRRRVHEWEDRLFNLTSGLTPVKPPPAVWSAIKERINPRRLTNKDTHKLGWWRAWGLVASVMLVVMSVMLVQFQPPTDQPHITVSVLSNKSAQAAWVIHADTGRQQLSVQVLNVEDPGQQKAYELWMLPKDQAPKSLGLLPLQGQVQIALTPERRAILRRSSALAVSLEPAGGSPTGAPTGPVLYQGKLLKI